MIKNVQPAKSERKFNGRIGSLILFFVLSFNLSNAQLLQWNTFGNLGTETTEPSVFNDPNIVGPVNLTLGTITPAANGNRFGGSGWFDTGNTVAGNTLAEAVAGNDYIQFIVAPQTGYSFTPTSFVFTWDRSATGPSSVTLRSSADGFSADLGTVTGMISGGAATTTTRTITITTLTNITLATTFRLYGYGATGTGGTGGFDNASSVVDVQLNGTVTSVGAPPPTQLAVTAITPSTPTAAGSTFSVTVQSLDGSNVASNVISTTGFSLSTNGNAGTIGGSTSGSITNGTNSIVVNGITLSSAGTGATITATRTSGDVLTAGTSSAFNVLPAAPVAATASPINATDFTANWSAVNGTSSYRLDVASAPFPVNATDLFISEYVEGSSSNKYIEIFNGTGASVNLADYKLRLYSNGVSSPTNDVALSGTLANLSTIVYKNTGATIYGGTATINAAVNFNGDDAVALFKVSTNANVDIFGRIGEDPGTEWTAAVGYSTLDKTLVRKSSVTGGVTTNPGAGFPTLATEWDVFNQDVVSDLGTHNFPTTPSYVSGYQDLTVAGTSQSVTGLTPNHTYYYRARAVAGSGTSVNSNIISATTLCSSVSLALNTQINASCYGAADGIIVMNPSGGTVPYTTSGTGPVFTVITETKNHSSPYFGTGSAIGFTLDGVQGKELTLVRGITYSFSVLTPGHPFVISSNAVGGGANSASVITNGVTNSGTTSGTLTFTPNGTHPSLLYYQCDVHANMGWRIHIVNQLINGNLGSCMAGNYSLNTTDANGCASSSPLNVSVTEPAANTFYYDSDIDNYGDDNESAIGCTAPTGFVPAGGDCDDGNAAINPGATEICNGIDDNCDNNIDEGITVTTSDAGPDQQVCISNSTLAGTAPGSGEDGLWQVVSGSGSFTDDTQYNSTISGLGSGANVFSWTLNHGTCATSSDEVTITVNPQPTAAISGNNTACLGQSSTVQLDFTGAGPWDYTITGSGGPYTGTTSGNPANINVTPTATGTQTYTVTSVVSAFCPTGGTTSGSATVDVSTVPPPSSGPVPAGAAEACANAVMLITSNVIPGQNITYSWNTGSNSSTVLFSTSVSGPFSPGPFTTVTSQVYAQFGALGGGQSGYHVCLQGVNGCGSGINKCLWIRGTVSGPGAITPSNGVVACENTTQLYSCGLSAGAAIYNWTLNGSAAAITPNGGNNPTNVSVSFPSGFTTGQLCVTAALACGSSSTSPARCMSISKNPANPNVPTGAAAVCPGVMGVSYSIQAVPGATGYNWTVPANATIATGTNSPSITVNFPTPYNGTSTVCVTTTSACGASAVKCKNVASGIPNQPAGITGPLTNVCGSTLQYSVVSPPGGLTYTWTNPSGTTISGPSTGSTILLAVSPGFTSGFLTVAANSSLCPPATSAVKTSSTFWGRPNNPGAITQNPPGAFCSGASLNFSVVNPVTGPVPTYTWTSSNGAITSLQGPNNIDVHWGTNAPGTITVKAGNGCGLSAGTSSQVFTPNNCREEGISTVSATGFSVYPNPAYGKTTVSFYSETSFNYTLKVIDYLGREVFTNELKAIAGDNTQEVDISHLAKGIYLVEVAGNDLTQKVKMIVQ